MAPAAIGLRAHSGWAALVAVGGTRNACEVLTRRRIDLAGPSGKGPTQPYHEAEGQPLVKAREVVEHHAAKAKQLARESLAAVIEDLRREGYEVGRCGLLAASGRPLPELEAVLASHALIHSADGELFRDALEDAARAQRLGFIRIREKEIYARASETLGMAQDTLKRYITEAGKRVGPPWAQDQKLAALAAWVALVSRAAAPE